MRARDDPKPFSRAEHQRLVGVARKHETLGPVLRGRGRVILAEPHFPARDDAGRAILAVYDYERDRTLVALVDRAGGKVVSVSESPVPFQLSDEEADEAEALANRDQRVKRFLGRRPMNPLTRLYFPPTNSHRRYAIVFLRPNGSERQYAVVDLSKRRVAQVLSHVEFTGTPENR